MKSIFSTLLERFSSTWRLSSKDGNPTAYLGNMFQLFTMPHILKVSPTSTKASLLNCTVIFSSPDLTGNRDQFVNRILCRIFYLLIPPHNTFLSEQNNAIYFRVMAPRLPTILLYSTLPNCQMILFFFFLTAVTKIGHYFNFKLQNIKYERRLFYAFYTAVNTSWHKVYFCWNWYDIFDSQSLQSGRTVRYPSLQNFCLARHSVLLQ